MHAMQFQLRVPNDQVHKLKARKSSTRVQLAQPIMSSAANSKTALRGGLPKGRNFGQYNISAPATATVMRAVMNQANRRERLHGPKLEEIVNCLVNMVVGTDGGQKLSDTQPAVVDQLINTLTIFGSEIKPLSDPRLFGNYDVSYVSGKSEKKSSLLRRFLFNTKTVQQNIYEPNVVVNKIGFWVLGIFPGQVTLQGTLAPEPAGQEQWVRLSFGEPKLSFLGLPPVKIGPKSSLVLRITYLDDKVRIGKGSKGSLFVFTRTGGGQESLKAAARTAISKRISFVLLSWVVIVYTMAFAVFHATKQLPPHLAPYLWGVTFVVACTLGYFMQNGCDDKPSVPAVA